MNSPWYVYILQCSDNTLYTGVTTNLDKRIEEHNNSIKGAKYTRSRRPVTLKFSIEVDNKSEALKEELKIKKLKRIHKLKLISKK